MPSPFTSLTHLSGLTAVALIAWLGWSNWELRGQLEQLAQQQENLSQRLQITQSLYDKAVARPNQTDCPAAQSLPNAAKPPTPVTSLDRPANPATVSHPPETAQVIQIPPGTDLREALQIIQREQAKKMGTEPGSAGVNPFGGTR